MGQPTENMGFMGQGRMLQIAHMHMLWTLGFHHEHTNLVLFKWSVCSWQYYVSDQIFLLEISCGFLSLFSLRNNPSVFAPNSQLSTGWQSMGTSTNCASVTPVSRSDLINLWSSKRSNWASSSSKRWITDDSVWSFVSTGSNKCAMLPCRASITSPSCNFAAMRLYTCYCLLSMKHARFSESTCTSMTNYQYGNKLDQEITIDYWQSVWMLSSPYSSCWSLLIVMDTS